MVKKYINAVIGTVNKKNILFVAIGAMPGSQMEAIKMGEKMRRTRAEAAQVCMVFASRDAEKGVAMPDERFTDP